MEDFLLKKAQTTLMQLRLEWLAFYEIRQDEVSMIASAGPAPTKKTFKIAEGSSVLGAEVLEPARFQDELLGFLGAESGGNLQVGTLTLELQSLASQLACFLRSNNKTRTQAIDSIVHKIHIGHPDKYNWTGVYLLNEKGLLQLESFRGEPTPHMVIHTNSGICGAAIRENRMLNIADVTADSRYLSCSLKTKSEIVVPISRQGRIIGEIDIDSHVKNAFNRHDEMELRNFSEQISGIPF